MKKEKSWKERAKIKQRRWQVHVEAWEKSGLRQNEYCRQHALTQYPILLLEKETETGRNI